MREVYVLMRFDVEDYIARATDSATLACANALARRGLTGVFKVVGEYARRLVRDGRTDVLASLHQHDLGYHTDWHSKPPTPAQYLAGMGWEEGVEEFVRREAPGVDDVRRVLGTDLSCYGQPGGSWAPQVFGALPRLGIPAYLGRRSLVSSGGQPFHYCGLLNVAHLKHDIGSGFPLEDRQYQDDLLQRVDQALDDGANPAGALVCLTCHPARLALDGRDSDAENFRRAHDREPSRWVVPALKSPAQARKAYAGFERVLDRLTGRADCHIVTMRDALELYRDRAKGKRFGSAPMTRIAEAARERVHFAQIDGVWLSAAEMLWLVCRAVTDQSPGTAGPVCGPFLGPVNRVQTKVTVADLASPLLVQAASATCAYMARQGRVPDQVHLGEHATLSPGDFLATVSGLLLEAPHAGRMPSRVRLAQGHEDWSDYINTEQARAAWDWVCLPEGFCSPGLYALAELQCWSLKPAALQA